jgi:hypothetical protein
MSRRIARIVVVLATLFWAASAAAQVSISQVTVGHPTMDAPKRTAQAQNYVSFEDCQKEQYKASFSIVGPSTVNVYATEANVDCSQTAATTTGTSTNAGGCHIDTNGCCRIALNVPTATPIVITGRDLVKSLESPPAATSCVDPTDAEQGHMVTVFFVASGAAATSSSGTTSNASTTWSTTVDLVGPSVPAGLDMSAGNQLLILSLPNVPDSDRQGYNVYCNPAIDGVGGPYDAGASKSSSSTSTSSSGKSSTSSGDGGTGGDAGTGGNAGGAAAAGGAGTGGGTTAKAECSDTIPGLVAGVPPPADAPVCTKLGPSVTSTPLGDAVNGVPYVVAVAAYDAVNNIGPLSYSLCETPAPTDTFLPVYCKDYGDGCPGCTVQPSSSLTWPGLATAAIGAVAFGARRRSRAKPGRRASVPAGKGAGSAVIGPPVADTGPPYLPTC